MATYIGSQCLSSCARNIQMMTPATATKLQVGRQLLNLYTPLLCPAPSRCVSGSERFKGERRKKAMLTKKDRQRLEQAARFRKDTNEMIMHRLRMAGMKMGMPDTSRPITITCTSAVFEPYVPPEGDGRSSSLSTEGAKQRLERVKNAGQAHLSMRRIRKYEPEYSNTEFAWQAQQIFIDAHKALQDFDPDLLHSLVTEKCYPEMTTGSRSKTIRWKFLESIEKPRVVHIRCTELMNKTNQYGQVTVRMHTRQTLAIYDRFGRIMFGNEDVPKDVLEYIVFEKHLPSRNGAWRMHAKISPPWASDRDPIVKTMIVPQYEDEEEGVEETAEAEEEVGSKVEIAQS